MLAGLGAKIFNSKEELLLLLKGGKEFTPKMTKNERETTLSLWNKAVRQTICK
jgi:glycerol kinase